MRRLSSLFCFLRSIFRGLGQLDEKKHHHHIFSYLNLAGKKTNFLPEIVLRGSYTA